MSKQQRQYDDSADVRARATVEFLSSLKFSRPLADLRAHTNRDECPQCHKRRQFYCYDCLVVTSPSTHPPPLHLPLHVHVVLHPGENRGKSTTLPIATVSPDVTIHTYPTVPELNPATTLVLYPSASAVEIEEVTDVTAVTDVVFVDSTWQQSKAIAADERVTKYRHVKLSGIVSLFWRFQDRDPYHLATVEAIYHAVRRLIAARNRVAARGVSTTTESAPAAGGASLDAKAARIVGLLPELDRYYHGEVDDLLFYYTNQYIAVQQSYQYGDRVFTGKHFDGYVLRDIDWDALLNASRDGTRVNAAQLLLKKNGGTAADGASDQAAPPQPPAEGSNNDLAPPPS